MNAFIYLVIGQLFASEHQRQTQPEMVATLTRIVSRSPWVYCRFQLITLTFNEIRTDSSDFINFYDGITSLASLMSTYSGPTDPPFPVLMTSQRFMFIRFTSDWLTADSGFSATYTSVPPTTCKCLFKSGQSSYYLSWTRYISRAPFIAHQSPCLSFELIWNSFRLQ
jgi:CUB domain